MHQTIYSSRWVIHWCVHSISFYPFYSSYNNRIKVKENELNVKISSENLHYQWQPVDLQSHRMFPLFTKNCKYILRYHRKNFRYEIKLNEKLLWCVTTYTNYANSANIDKLFFDSLYRERAWKVVITSYT